MTQKGLSKRKAWTCLTWLSTSNLVQRLGQSRRKNEYKSEEIFGGVFSTREVVKSVHPFDLGSRKKSTKITFKNFDQGPDSWLTSAGADIKAFGEECKTKHAQGEKNHSRNNMGRDKEKQKVGDATQNCIKRGHSENFERRESKDKRTRGGKKIWKSENWKLYLRLSALHQKRALQRKQHWHCKSTSQKEEKVWNE